MMPASAKRIWTRRPGRFTLRRSERATQLVDDDRGHVTGRVRVRENERGPPQRFRLAPYCRKGAHALACEDEEGEQREPGCRRVGRGAVWPGRGAQALGEGSGLLRGALDAVDDAHCAHHQLASAERTDQTDVDSP